jgi:hypothetical protein
MFRMHIFIYKFVATKKNFISNFANLQKQKYEEDSWGVLKYYFINYNFPFRNQLFVTLW